jgi:hypothetical protein
MALLALASIVAPAMAASATCPTCLASGYVEKTDIDEDKLIPGAWPTQEDAKRCIFKGSCPHLEDVMYKDVDISDQMQDYEEGAGFHVFNQLVSTTTLWFVCSYDGDGNALKCWYDRDRSWGLSGDLSPDARELRLMPVQSAPNEYRLDVYVY